MAESYNEWHARVTREDWISAEFWSIIDHNWTVRRLNAMPRWKRLFYPGTP